MRRLVDEQVGEHAAAERPVAAPLGPHGPVERHLLRRRSQLLAVDVELVAQPHVPVDRRGCHVLRERVVAPLAADVVAVVARLALEDVADLAGLDVIVGGQPGRVGHRLHADRHDLVLLLGGVDDGDRLGDRARHRLFHVDVLAGVHGVQGHAGVPVVGRGDADHVHVLLVENDAVVLADVFLVSLVQAAGLRRRVEAAALAVGVLGVAALAQREIAVPHVADGDGADALGLFPQVEDGVNVLLGAAADAEEGDADGVVGAADLRVGRGRERECGGPGGGALEEFPAVDSHISSPLIQGQMAPIRLLYERCRRESDRKPHELRA